jgi:hypothetical protein
MICIPIPEIKYMPNMNFQCGFTIRKKPITLGGLQNEINNIAELLRGYCLQTRRRDR